MHLFGGIVGFLESLSDPSFGVGEDVEGVFVGGFVAERGGATSSVMLDVWEEKGRDGCQEEEVEG
jgi:hypothetical protein